MKIVAEDEIPRVSSVFDGCKVVFELDTNVRYKQKTALKELVIKNGGVVSYILTKQCTYLVVSSKEKAQSYRCQTASKYGVPVVLADFLQDSVKAGKLQDLQKYLVVKEDHKVSDSKIKESQKSLKIVHHLEEDVCHISSKVWDQYDKNKPQFDEESFELAKCALFRERSDSIPAKENMIYVFEIHVSKRPEVTKGQEETKGDNPRFRLFTQQCRYSKGNAQSINYIYSNSADKIVEMYSKKCEEVQKIHNAERVTNIQQIPLEVLGTPQFRKLCREKAVTETPDAKVRALVKHVWEEAVGHLDQILSVAVDRIKLEQVEKAEGVLVQIKEALEEPSSVKDVENLSSQFYEALPHMNPVTISNKLMLCKKKDLCQLIRDLTTVGETTHWQKYPSEVATYKALRCSLEYMKTTDLDFQTVTSLVEDSLTRRDGMEIVNVFTVQRPMEEDVFRHDLCPKKLLFHASNFSHYLGILSRGLLLPKLVVNEYGGSRTDPGNLGYGIYFAESASVSCAYSGVSQSRGTRFMLIAEVALGESFEVYTEQFDLTVPPKGYDSVHGVADSPNQPSSFKDDEFAIYHSNQQRLKYLVEFILPGDTPLPVPLQPISSMKSSDLGHLDFSDIMTDVTSVQSKEDPLSKVTSGLVSSGDASVPLKSVHIRARLLDLAAQVVVLQEYSNDLNTAIEAKYVFPLDDLAAVCGFEAFINGKHIVGEVKEKATAHKEYKEAVSAGHGAYLMDQDEETPDVFTVSVGNLPPKASVLIKITYVAELLTDDGLISFSLPGSVAPWKRDSALDQTTQTVVDTLKVDSSIGENTSLQISVNMPFDIKSIESPTHKLKKKTTASRAVLELEKNQTLEGGFQLLIGLSEIHVPRMWVEEHPDKENSQACMLTFYPEIDAENSGLRKIVFLLDMSNSVKEKAAKEAVTLLVMLLNQLDKNTLFNVIVFGTDSEEVFSVYQPVNRTSIQTVLDFLKKKVTSTRGGTDLYHPLHTLLLLQPISTPLNVLLISDGHINNEEMIFHDLMINSTSLRLFTLGVSDTANRHRLRSLARVGSGCFEFFDSKLKSKWNAKVKSVLYRVSQPSLTSVNVQWHQYNNNPTPPIQAPRQIMSLFTGTRQVVYGFVSDCQMATLKGVVNGEEISTVVSSSHLSNTKGTIVHKLTARGVIRDWEDGVLSLDRHKHEADRLGLKEYVIKLSKEYSIVTQLTSFVAVEERTKDETVSVTSDAQMEELIKAENVDDLPYIGWETPSLDVKVAKAQDGLTVAEEVPAGEGLGGGGSSIILDGDFCSSWSYFDSEEDYIEMADDFDDEDQCRTPTYSSPVFSTPLPPEDYMEKSADFESDEDFGLRLEDFPPLHQEKFFQMPAGVEGGESVSADDDITLTPPVYMDPKYFTQTSCTSKLRESKISMEELSLGLKENFSIKRDSKKKRLSMRFADSREDEPVKIRSPVSLLARKPDKEKEIQIQEVAVKETSPSGDMDLYFAECYDSRSTAKPKKRHKKFEYLSAKCLSVPVAIPPQQCAGRFEESAEYLEFSKRIPKRPQPSISAPLLPGTSAGKQPPLPDASAGKQSLLPSSPSKFQSALPPCSSRGFVVLPPPPTASTFGSSPPPTPPSKFGSTPPPPPPKTFSAAPPPPPPSKLESAPPPPPPSKLESAPPPPPPSKLESAPPPPPPSKLEPAPPLPPPSKLEPAPPLPPRGTSAAAPPPPPPSKLEPAPPLPPRGTSASAPPLPSPSKLEPAPPLPPRGTSAAAPPPPTPSKFEPVPLSPSPLQAEAALSISTPALKSLQPMARMRKLRSCSFGVPTSSLKTICSSNQQNMCAGIPEQDAQVRSKRKNVPALVQHQRESPVVPSILCAANGTSDILLKPSLAEDLHKEVREEDERTVDHVDKEACRKVTAPRKRREAGSRRVHRKVFGPVAHSMLTEAETVRNKDIRSCVAGSSDSKPFTPGSPQGLQLHSAKSSVLVTAAFKKLTAALLVDLFEIQLDDGTWTFSEKFSAVLGLDSDKCKNTLYSAGLQSLGQKVTEEVMNLVATMIALTAVLVFLRSDKAPLQASDLRLDFNMDKFKHQLESKLLPGSQELRIVLEGVAKAVAFCKRVNEAQPSLYYQLELGQSWEQVIGAMLGLLE